MAHNVIIVITSSHTEEVKIYKHVHFFTSDKRLDCKELIKESIIFAGVLIERFVFVK